MFCRIVFWSFEKLSHKFCFKKFHWINSRPFQSLLRTAKNCSYEGRLNRNVDCSKCIGQLLFDKRTSFLAKCTFRFFDETLQKAGSEPVNTDSKLAFFYF